MVPALAPIISGGIKTIASAGLFEGARRALPKLASKAKGWIGKNPGKAAKSGGIIGGIGIGGKTISDYLEQVGIEDNQIQAAISIGLVIAAVAAVGQLFDINL